MQIQKEKKEQLLFQIEDLKKEHALLSDVITKANQKIMNLTEGTLLFRLAIMCYSLLTVLGVFADLAATGSPNVLNIM